jgi:hypothetical protein
MFQQLQNITLVVNRIVDVDNCVSYISPQIFLKLDFKNRSASEPSKQWNPACLNGDFLFFGGSGPYPFGECQRFKHPGLNT